MMKVKLIQKELILIKILFSILSISRKAARESFVLLKNDNNVLPLANNKINSAT